MIDDDFLHRAGTLWSGMLLRFWKEKTTQNSQNRKLIHTPIPLHLCLCSHGDDPIIICVILSCVVGGLGWCCGRLLLWGTRPLLRSLVDLLLNSSRKETSLTSLMSALKTCEFAATKFYHASFDGVGIVLALYLNLLMGLTTITNTKF